MRRAETLSLETPPVTTEWDSSWRLHIYSPFLLQHYLMIHLESTQWLWVKNKIALGKKSGGSYLDLMNEWWFILTLSLSSLIESNTWDLRLNLVGMKITLLNMNRVKKERNYTNQNPPPPSYIIVMLRVQWCYLCKPATPPTPVLYQRDAESSVPRCQREKSKSILNLSVFFGVVFGCRVLFAH